MDGFGPSYLENEPDVLKLDKWTSHLESEVGIGPTFAVLQTDAYSSIDNSPIEMAGSEWIEHPSSVLETEIMPLYDDPIEMVACIHIKSSLHYRQVWKTTIATAKNIFMQCKAWNGTPNRIQTDSGTFVASLSIQLAYGSIEKELSVFAAVW